GQIGGNASINVLASSGITAGGDVSFDLGNNHGSGTPAGIIGGNAMIDVTAGHISAGNFIHGTIDNEGGTVGGAATISLDISGAIASQNNAFFTIIGNEDNGSGSGPGMIAGNATINVNAGSISIGGDDLFHSTIFNEGGGSIGGNAGIDFNISGDITTPSDIIFNIENGNINANGGGTIAGNAFIDVTAGNITANSLVVQIDNSTPGGNGTIGGSIGGDATINVTTGDITAGTLTAQIDNTGGSIGANTEGGATINMNVSGTATVTNDATVAIYGSDGAVGGAGININGGNYNVGGTFLSYIDGNGTITFNNASAHADVLKAGVFGTNGALNIGGGMLSADSTLKLYAPGSNGQLNFMSNVTLGGNAAKILAANSITISNNVVVTISIGGPIADVYTNHANYTGFGGNGTTTGTFAGAGAHNPQPLSSAPPFGPASPVKLTIGGNIPTGTGVPPQSRPARTPAAGGNITSRTRIPPPSPSNVLTGGKIADVRRANNVINVRSSDELLSLLDGAGPGPGGKITIPPSKHASNSKNSSRVDPAARLNAGNRVNVDRRAMDMRTASSAVMRRSPQ
ncbi:MAG TPA: hypothetical protein VK557_00085, partial [Pyrinomonadaceae bacterium]|nr:hypothetical protein [Pyrinomonadaceae bacterium]